MFDKNKCIRWWMLALLLAAVGMTTTGCLVDDRGGRDHDRGFEHRDDHHGDDHHGDDHHDWR